MAEKTSLIPLQRIESAILLMRGSKVLLDSDLAALYGVETRALVQAVKRNIHRFPSDFMFRLSKEEFAALKSQPVISNVKTGRGGRRSSSTDGPAERETTADRISCKTGEGVSFLHVAGNET